MGEVRWLSAAEERAWRGYRRMRTLLDLQISRDLATDSGLSDSDYDVLSTLTEAPEPVWRASDLAARLLWSSSRLAHHVGRMERRGLVVRGGCSDDGRGATVALTEEGWRQLREAAPKHVASVRLHFIDVLTPVEIEALATISAKVVAHLERPGASHARGAPGQSATQKTANIKVGSPSPSSAGRRGRL
jgi:DNA-binding MarR family transcriptional regulator